VLRISALPSLALDAIPTAVARFLRTHNDVKFDLQTVHHDDLLRKLYERESDVAIAYQVPPAAPIGHRWLGEGELVVLYREEDMPDAPPRIELEQLRGKRFISLAASGPIGQLFTQELQRLELELDEVVSARTFYIASALVRQGVGMTVVDSFTAQASLVPGLAMRPLKPQLTFDIHAMFLINRPPGALATEFLKTLGAGPRRITAGYSEPRTRYAWSGGAPDTFRPDDTGAFPRLSRPQRGRARHQDVARRRHLPARGLRRRVPLRRLHDELRFAAHDDGGSRGCGRADFDPRRRERGRVASQGSGRRCGRGAGGGHERRRRLHERLRGVPRLAALADERGLQLFDVREPPADLKVGKGYPRAGHRLLTVGTDCSVGKMYATLALTRGLRSAVSRRISELRGRRASSSQGRGSRRCRGRGLHRRGDRAACAGARG
jgi:hypothetical protein